MSHAPRDDGVRSYHEVIGDGLVDMFFGLLVAVLIGHAMLGGTRIVAGTPLIGQAALFCSVVALAMAFESARRHITFRRIGHPEETAELARRQAIVMFVILLSLLVGAALPFVLPYVPTLAKGNFVPVLLAGVVTLVSAAVAIAFESPRFWLYALLFGLPILLQRTLAEAGLLSNLAVYFGASAAVAVVVGATLLARFVRRHPLPPAGHAPRTPAHA